jgi:Skp family chaperone for outer membrane proteins
VQNTATFHLSSFLPATQRSAFAVKKLILTCLGLACLSAGSYFLGSDVGFAQGGKNPADEVPHKVGLVDMQYIFENYEKMKYLREDLVAEGKQAQDKYNNYVEQIKALQEELKTFKEGGPEFAKVENKLAKVSTELETFKKVEQRAQQRKLIKIQHSVYLEIKDAVTRMCKHHGYTLVIQTKRDEANTNDPQIQAAALNRLVIYNRGRDDLTKPVLEMLNAEFSAGEAAVGANEGRGKVKRASKNVAE